MREQDIELFHRVQNKDEVALELLYDRYEKLLFSFSFRMTNNKFLAEEAVQDVFTKLWSKSLPYSEEKGKFSSWLLTITRNTCLDLLRKKKSNDYELKERDALQEDNDPSPEETAEWKEQHEEIQHAIKELKTEQQEIINLFYFRGFTQSQIAKKCNLPLGTVKGRVRLSLQHLNKILTKKKERGIRE
ncbi:MULTISPECIES: RNA polymerase sigma factor [Virgibacillus]|uniref:Sigma-K factor n=1 Tax=Virgibacillus massiliensis TaxID=1462526 RepID=A0A024QEM3_9BACI|nr:MULTISPECIES: sigma-70 family RNA polymerase sigma factor [Virgibacillus]EQB38814.1 hypothetical protein M948_00285 [Virgibacillus sp. CM-4]MYL43832.1 sigma-70 family RNA polymerase sigma factor [Virgibacillus massiliensis]CDQ40939.1 Sigma-K factor [Virgibacillus massiliensis]